MAEHQSHTIEGLYIRPAVPADKEAVLHFCQRTWDWGDYIAEVWDAWLAEPGARMLVGIVGERPVAVGHVRLVAAGEGWLQGMRVDPECRGRGIAAAFTERAVAEALALSARTVRLATLATNEPVRRIMARLGFRPVAGFSFYHATPATLAREADGVDVLGERDLAELLAYLERSPVFAASGRLYSTDWAWHELTPDKLRRRLAAGDVLGRQEAGVLVALAVVAPADGGLVVEYADGQREALASLATALARRVPTQNVEQVRARLLDHPDVISPFAAAGYVFDGYGPLLIFERHFAGT